ncbi:P63C domain-containing protein [Providencia rettgeri]|uniref:P63C domain-containing protein n=1 Tax=Providencia rettgeri TaxID=587 RepID=UPI0032DB9375
MSNKDDVKKEVKGKARGGIARAKSLTKEQRSEIAKKAASARWKDKPVIAKHKGNFFDEFGIDIDCYVLDDKNKTGVISQRGMAEALGMSEGGSKLKRFVNGKIISQFIGPELKEKIDNPVIFQYINDGPNGAVKPIVHGYDVTILIDICKAIIEAKSQNKLVATQDHLAKQAQVIVNASAKAGIQGLVYALSGYDRTKEEVIASYKRYVAEEAREYEREFTQELYDQWYRLYGLSKPERGRPWELRYLTIEHIYMPLANSNGKVYGLAKTSRADNGIKNKKIHQFLSEVGVKALRTQIGKVTGIAMVSDSREEYERHIEEKIFGQKQLPFDDSEQ